jgi:hypothetical protein
MSWASPRRSWLSSARFLTGFVSARYVGRAHVAACRSRMRGAPNSLLAPCNLPGCAGVLGLSPACGYSGAATAWLRLGYGLATAWLRLGYGLATAWLRPGYGLATAWLRCGLGVDTVWLRCGAGVDTPWLRCGLRAATV